MLKTSFFNFSKKKNPLKHHFLRFLNITHIYPSELSDIETIMLVFLPLYDSKQLSWRGSFHTWIKSNLKSFFSLFKMREICDIFMKNKRKRSFSSLKKNVNFYLEHWLFFKNLSQIEKKTTATKFKTTRKMRWNFILFIFWDALKYVQSGNPFLVMVFSERPIMGAIHHKCLKET